ncbi:KR domain-containing protein [Streptomyces sp. URMC 128]|uniref:KR domain-containing protein n=1 Tax=Streptomyces sp. URMC 128 TaxID=3423404 RepID=UPI003F1AC638
MALPPCPWPAGSGPAAVFRILDGGGGRTTGRPHAVRSRAASGADLDLFVTYSSIAAAVGNIGQAPYAAGTARLEAQARARHPQGRLATALAFGPIGETGHVAWHAIGDARAERGFQSLSVAEALTTAGGLFRPGTDVAGVGRCRWSRARRLVPDLAIALFTRLVPVDAGPGTEGRADLSRELAAVTPTRPGPRSPGPRPGCSPPSCTTTPLVPAGEHVDVRLAATELMGGDSMLTTSHNWCAAGWNSPGGCPRGPSPRGRGNSPRHLQSTSARPVVSSRNPPDWCCHSFA